jgi:hypothetical protein
MKSHAKRDGLSARRKTILIDKLSRPAVRKFLPGMLSMILVVLGSCQDKTHGQQTADTTRANAVQDSTHKPTVNIKVNRRFDDKGNLIGFDSLYSTYYSSTDKNAPAMDSMMNSFNNYFHRDHALFFNNRFDNLFFNDSLHYPDFFHKDFFMKHYLMNDGYMKQMMMQMDSIKNHFYNDRHLKDGEDKSEKDNNAKSHS